MSIDHDITREDLQRHALPHLEFAFEIKLRFADIQNIANMPSGAGRGAVYIAGGTISGPRLNRTVIERSGADWALFRPDSTLATDARYMLRADDGTLILMHNRGFCGAERQMSLGTSRIGCSAAGRP